MRTPYTNVQRIKRLIRVPKIAPAIGHRVRHWTNVCTTTNYLKIHQTNRTISFASNGNRNSSERNSARIADAVPMDVNLISTTNDVLQRQISTLPPHWIRTDVRIVRTTLSTKRKIKRPKKRKPPKQKRSSRQRTKQQRKKLTKRKKWSSRTWKRIKKIKKHHPKKKLIKSSPIERRKPLRTRKPSRRPPIRRIGNHNPNYEGQIWNHWSLSINNWIV